MAVAELQWKRNADCSDNDSGGVGVLSEATQVVQSGEMEWGWCPLRHRAHSPQKAAITIH